MNSIETKQAWTPGPWKRDSKGDLRGANGEPIYFKGADGQIMETAPELVEALRTIATRLTKGPRHNASDKAMQLIASVAEAALRKAGAL